MPSHQVTARNFSAAHENRMHSDEVAQRYGFKGALVPGVAVYGYLTHPLVSRFGAGWLGHATAALKLIKPAYDGDRLDVELTEDNGQHLVRCCNQGGVLLAELRTPIAGELPPPATPLCLSRKPQRRRRVEIEWDAVALEVPFQPWWWEVSAAENQELCRQVSDHLDIYSSHVHPHAILAVANQALMWEYWMPAWIHTVSEVRHRLPILVGDRLRVRSVVLEKWRRKGHEFLRLYLALHRNDTLTTEILHTAIFKVAG